VLAANKSILDRLGIDQTIEQENLLGPQLLSQPVVQPPPAVATALPLEGNLNPNALVPVIVQPRLLSAAIYSAPHTGNGRHISNPVAAGLLRGRGSA
jgi:hypothetical protein